MPILAAPWAGMSRGRRGRRVPLARRHRRVPLAHRLQLARRAGLLQLARRARLLQLAAEPGYCSSPSSQGSQNPICAAWVLQRGSGCVPYLVGQMPEALTVTSLLVRAGDAKVEHGQHEAGHARSSRRTSSAFRPGRAGVAETHLASLRMSWCSCDTMSWCWSEISCLSSGSCRVWRNKQATGASQRHGTIAPSHVPAAGMHAQFRRCRGRAWRHRGTAQGTPR